MLVRGAHDQRVQRPHFLVQETDGIVLGIVRTEAVRADHLREPVRLVRGSHVARAAHFRKAHPQSGFG